MIFVSLCLRMVAFVYFLNTDMFYKIFFGNTICIIYMKMGKLLCATVLLWYFRI